MTTVFADTFYFLALLDSREDRHQQAAEVSRNPQLHILTTEWVLAEFGDAYCNPNQRLNSLRSLRSLAAREICLHRCSSAVFASTRFGATRKFLQLGSPGQNSKLVSEWNCATCDTSSRSPKNKT